MPEFTPIGTYIRTDLQKWEHQIIQNNILIDRRNGTPMEMDGYSTYLALRASETHDNATNQPARNKIVAALFQRLEECDGLWSSGAWTGSPKEIHCRFTAAAIRTLIQAAVDGVDIDNNVVLDLLQRHIALHEELTIGTWFLHDSIEVPTYGLSMKEPPFPSKLWGKSEANCLVLNTHIDTLITIMDALERLPVPDALRLEFEALTRSGLRAVIHTLSQTSERIGEALFFVIDAPIRKLLLYIDDTKNRYLNFLKWRIIEQYYSRRAAIKTKNPILVCPDGYLERDICLSGYFFFYHVVNLHDIARLALIARRTGFMEAEEFRFLENIVHAAINYAVSDPYRTYMLKTTSSDGRAATLIEGMLLRAAMTKNFQLPVSWHSMASTIMDAVAPTPALMGFDPFVVRSANMQDSRTDFVLLNGDHLSIKKHQRHRPVNQ